MSKKSKQTAVVISQEKLAEGIYDLWIETGLAKEAVLRATRHLCVIRWM